MEQITINPDADIAKWSPENFVQNFYSHFCNLDFHEQKLLLLNLNAQLNYKGRPVLHNGLLERITNREKEVLVLIAHGYSRKEIASSLKISSNTAARHISNIYSKLDIHSVAEATRLAIANNLTA